MARRCRPARNHCGRRRVYPRPPLGPDPRGSRPTRPGGPVAVRIVTDSACDLPQARADALGIEIVPLTIRFGDEEFVDRVELSNEEFWRKVSTSPVLPETAAPSPGAFEERFRALADAGADGVVCIN